jgi:hypothetical protein
VVVQLLEQAPAHLFLLPAAGAVPAEAVAGGVRSYVADGRCVVWAPPDRGTGARIAVDAEIAAQPVPPALARRSGIADPAVFWPRWTVVEASCKVTGIALSRWLRTRGLCNEPSLPVRTLVLEDLVVSCAFASVTPDVHLGAPEPFLRRGGLPSCPH